MHLNNKIITFQPKSFGLQGSKWKMVYGLKVYNRGRTASSNFSAKSMSGNLRKLRRKTCRMERQHVWLVFEGDISAGVGPVSIKGNSDALRSAYLVGRDQQMFHESEFMRLRILRIILNIL
jgi:hypothetical protein